MTGIEPKIKIYSQTKACQKQVENNFLTKQPKQNNQARDSEGQVRVITRFQKNKNNKNKNLPRKKKTKKISRKSPIETLLKGKTHIYKSLFTKPEQMAEKKLRQTNCIEKRKVLFI